MDTGRVALYILRARESLRLFYFVGDLEQKLSVRKNA